MKFSVSDLFGFFVLLSVGCVINTWPSSSQKISSNYFTYESKEFGLPFTYRTTWETPEAKPRNLTRTIRMQASEQHSDRSYVSVKAMVMNALFWIALATGAMFAFRSVFSPRD